MQTFFITYALTSTVNYIVEVQAERGKEVGGEKWPDAYYDQS